MCLLIKQPKNLPALSNDWLTDFYLYNPDGVGVMYSNGKGRLIVKKALPKHEGELISFYHQYIAGRECAWHLRMRTHGNTDLVNCHPYPVLNYKNHGIDLQFMHNGILHTGNADNPTMSDTHHYAARFLTPLLAKNPDLIFNPALQDMIGNQIGNSNKFIIMDSLGRTVTINESAGVKWGGLWLSNTYAWSAPPSLLPKRTTRGEQRALAGVYYNPWDDTSWPGGSGFDYM